MEDQIVNETVNGADKMTAHAWMPRELPEASDPVFRAEHAAAVRRSQGFTKPLLKRDPLRAHGIIAALER